MTRSLLEAWWENRDRAIYPPAIVNGNDLINEFGLEPGPTVGSLLERIHEAQATGLVRNRRQALELASESVIFVWDCKSWKRNPIVWNVGQYSQVRQWPLI